MREGESCVWFRSLALFVRLVAVERGDGGWKREEGLGRGAYLKSVNGFWFLLSYRAETECNWHFAVVGEVGLGRVMWRVKLLGSWEWRSLMVMRVLCGEDEVNLCY